MSKINIGILHAHNTLNYGSMMMCENAIHYLSEILPHSHFIVLSDFLEETSYRLKHATLRDNIEVRRRTTTFSDVSSISETPPSFIDKTLLRYSNLIKMLEDCHAVIVLGGDDISEYYGVPRLFDILLRLKFLKGAGKKIYLLGQSIGPIHSWRKVAARSVLNKVDRIYHRGPTSYEFVTSTLKVKHNSHLASDLAFLDLARHTSVDEVTQSRLKPGDYITFVPSGIWSKYSDNYAAYFDGLVNITEFLIMKCEELGKRLVLLGHVLRASDDRVLLNQITNTLKKSDIVSINCALLPCQARAILGSSHFVVTQRMHGAISSFQSGIPAMSISYSIKYSDVIGNYLGLPQLVVEANKATFATDTKKICSSIHDALQDLPNLRAKVALAAYKAKKDALRQMEDIGKDILFAAEQNHL